jgi:hypothetical protein
VQGDVLLILVLTSLIGNMVSVRVTYGQATLNSAYRPEMPNRAEIRGTVGAEFSAHAFQSFHSLCSSRTIVLEIRPLTVRELAISTANCHSCGEQNCNILRTKTLMSTDCREATVTYFIALE